MRFRATLFRPAGRLGVVISLPLVRSGGLGSVRGRIRIGAAGVAVGASASLLADVGADEGARPVSNGRGTSPRPQGTTCSPNLPVQPPADAALWWQPPGSARATARPRETRRPRKSPDGPRLASHGCDPTPA